MSYLQGSNSIIPKDTTVVNDLAQVVASIALKHFDWQYVTFALYNTTFFCGINMFVETYRKSVILGRGTFYPRFVENTRQFVIFGTDLANIVNMLNWLRRHQFDNTGKYVIMCTSQYALDCNENEAVKTLWNYKIINVIFIKSEIQENKINAYTYFYKDYDCHQVRPEKINWYSCINIYNNEDCDLFPSKLKNLNMCPVTVSTFTQKPYMKITNGIPTGADGDLLRLIAEKLNATLDIITPQIGYGWGKLEEDGSWSGSLSDVYYDLANFSMTSASITLSRFSYFQMSIDYNTINVVWVTHPLTMEPPSLKLFRPLKLYVRIALVLSFLLVIVLSFILRSKYWDTFYKNLKVSRPRRSLVFYSWKIFMGLPSTKLPTKSAYLFIILLWIWYCFLIRTFYTVYLMKSLKNNVYYADIQKIEDAIASNYAIGGGSALKDYFVEDPLIYNRWINLESNEIYSTMVNMSEGVKFIIAMNLETVKNFLKNPERNLNILPQKVLNSPTVIFFKKFSPLVQPINNILTCLVENGFTTKLYRNYTSSKRSTIKATPKKKVAINIMHYTGCYAIMIIGWMLSIISFVIEVVIGNMRYFKRLN